MKTILVVRNLPLIAFIALAFAQITNGMEQYKEKFRSVQTNFSLFSDDHQLNDQLNERINRDIEIAQRNEKNAINKLILDLIDTQAKNKQLTEELNSTTKKMSEQTKEIEALKLKLMLGVSCKPLSCGPDKIFIIKRLFKKYQKQ